MVGALHALHVRRYVAPEWRYVTRTGRLPGRQMVISPRYMGRYVARYKMQRDVALGWISVPLPLATPSPSFSLPLLKVPPHSGIGLISWACSPDPLKVNTSSSWRQR